MPVPFQASLLQQNLKGASKQVSPLEQIEASNQESPFNRATTEASTFDEAATCDDGAMMPDDVETVCEEDLLKEEEELEELASWEVDVSDLKPVVKPKGWCTCINS